MSTVTGPSEFSSYTEATDGDDAWVNPGNVITSSASAATANNLLGYPDYESTHQIRMYDWGGSGSVDTNAVIENISVAITNETDGSTYNWLPNLYFSLATGGSRNTKMRTSKGTTTFSGDLSYWGITNAEALAAIHATASANNRNALYIRSGQYTYNNSVYLVTMTVTWSERPPAGGVLLGGFS